MNYKVLLVCVISIIVPYILNRSPITIDTITQCHDKYNIQCVLGNTSHGTLYVSIVSAGYLDLFSNMLCSYRTAGYEYDQLFIITTDTVSYNHIKHTYNDIHVLQVDIGLDENSSTEYIWASKQHILLNQIKITIIKQLLQYSIDCILIDSDIVLLNKFDHLIHDVDIQIMYDSNTDINPPSLPINHTAHEEYNQLFQCNGGFYYVRSNQYTIRLYGMLERYIIDNPDRHDQDALQYILRDMYQHNQLSFYNHTTSQYNTMVPSNDTVHNMLRICYFDPLYVVNGAVYFTSLRRKYLELSKLYSISRPYVIHVNWVIGKQQKIMLLKQYRLWYIDAESTCNIDTIHQIQYNHKHTEQILNTNIYIHTDRLNSTDIQSIQQYQYNHSTPLPLLLFTSMTPLAPLIEHNEKLQIMSQHHILNQYRHMSRQYNMMTLLYSNDQQHSILADSMHLDHINTITEYNHMFKLHDLFHTSQYIAQQRHCNNLMYTNSDILYNTEQLHELINVITSYQFYAYAAVGVRNNVNLYVQQQLLNRYRDINNTSHAIHNITQPQWIYNYFAGSSQRYRADAIDYMIYSINMIDLHQIPNFILGRIGYDNYLLHYCNQKAKHNNNVVTIDIGNILHALHLDHSAVSHTESHVHPDNMINIKLGGQMSLLGDGSIDRTSHITRRSNNNRLQIIRRPPATGILKLLYDSAAAATRIIDSYHQLVVITVTQSHIFQFDSFIRHNTHSNNNINNVLLVFGIGNNVCRHVREYHIQCFDLTSNQQQSDSLNDQSQVSYIHIVNLHARAIQYLLDYGYDVLLMDLSERWYIDVIEYINTQRIAPSDITMLYAGTQNTTQLYINHNMILLYHTPNTLHSWHRIAEQYNILAKQVREIPNSIDVTSFDPLWYIQYDIGSHDNMIVHTCNVHHQQMTYINTLVTDINPLIKQDILIYGDDGASPNLIHITKYSIEQIIDPNKYNIRIIHATYIINDTEWERNAVLLIMPGGRDLPYLRGLGTAGTARIRNWVESGGAYLGLCAGGYFGCRHIEFALGDELLKVTGERSLQFYPGNCIGPVWNDFQYNSEVGAHAAQLKLSGTDELIDIYFNGGGKFINASQYNNIDVLASYSETTTEPAIVLCYVGLGRAILTGVHPEIPANTLGDEVNDAVKQRLVDGEHRRIEYWAELISKLIDVEHGGWTQCRNTVNQLVVLQVTDDNKHRIIQWIDRCNYIQYIQYTILTDDKYVYDELHQYSTHVQYVACTTSWLLQQLYHNTELLLIEPNYIMMNDPLLFVHRGSEHIASVQTISDIDYTIHTESIIYITHGILRYSKLIEQCTTPSTVTQCIKSTISELQHTQHIQVNRLSPLHYPTSTQYYTGTQYMDTGITPCLIPLSYTDNIDGRVHSIDVAQWYNTNTQNNQIVEQNYSNQNNDIKLSIHIMTHNRSESLHRLLNSLNNAVYDPDDTLDITILIDTLTEHSVDYDGDVVDVADQFIFDYGTVDIIKHATHQGVLGQWLYHTGDTVQSIDNTYTLYLEDDTELSKYWYTTTKPLIQKYFANTNDTHLSSISMQNQLNVLGESYYNTLMTQQFNRSITVHDKLEYYNDTNIVYRYQLLGTWGLIVRQSHWLSFTQWYKSHTHNTFYQPCTPYLQSTQWFIHKPQQQMWSQWYIRYTYEYGLYTLYINYSQLHNQSLIINHREPGLNYQNKHIPDSVLINDIDTVHTIIQSLPDYSTVKLYDYNMDLVGVNSVVLQERQLTLSEKMRMNPCIAYQHNPNIHI